MLHHTSKLLDPGASLRSNSRASSESELILMSETIDDVISVNEAISNSFVLTARRQGKTRSRVLYHDLPISH